MKSEEALTDYMKDWSNEELASHIEDEAFMLELSNEELLAVSREVLLRLQAANAVYDLEDTLGIPIGGEDDAA